MYEKSIVVTAVAGYNIYTNLKSNAASDLMLANVEALATNESDAYEPGNECSGCILNCLYICKDFGWGGCIGDPNVHWS